MMVIKTGKFFLLFSIINWAVVVYAAPSITLTARDDRGRTLNEVAVNSPFYLDAEITSDQQNIPDAQIQRMSKLEILSHSTSTSIRVINGVASMQRRSSFVVKAAEQGPLTIGPASVIINGQLITSAQLKLVVSEQQKSDQAEDRIAWIDVVPDKTTVMVGEPLWITIRIVAKPGVELESAISGDFKGQGWQVRTQPNPVQKQHTINGQSYNVTEQRVELYSYDPGAKKIPALSLRCAVPVRVNPSSIWNMFDVMGRRSDPYDARSVAVPIEVMPLPGDKKIDLVGVIKRMSAQLNQSQAKVGEGVVLTIEVEGSGDVQRLTALPLALPEELTFYEAKQEIEDQAPGVQVPGLQTSKVSWKKTFEYIVQGRVTGTWSIPAQKLSYFDPERRVHDTTATQPLSLTITPGVMQSGVKAAVPPEPEQHAQPVSTADYATKMPWCALAGIVSLIVFIALVVGGVRRWKKYRREHVHERKRRKAFGTALAQLKIAQKANQAHSIYQIITQLFADRYIVPRSEVSEHFIMDLLREKKLSEQELTAWQQDFSAFAEHAFYRTTPSSDTKKLFERAQWWISLFKRRP